MSTEDDALSVLRSVTARARAAEGLRPERIADFLSRQADLGGALVELRLDETLRKSGASSGTQVLDVRLRDGQGGELERRLVFRYDLGGAFFIQYDLPTQFHIMRTLAAKGFPCPEALWLDVDGEIVGAPGLFMAFVDAPAPAAQPFAEGPLAQAAPDLRHAMILESVRTCARLNRLPVADLGLSVLDVRGRGDHFIDRELDWTSRELLHAIPEGFGGARQAYYDDARGALLKVRDRLSALAPRHRTPELVHGDTNLSNFMYRGDKVAVLLDWELCHLGLGEADLGYCIAGCAHFQHMLPPVTGAPSVTELADAYRAERGKLEDWDYCQLLGEWRLAVFQAMAFSRLPAAMTHLEEAYWAHTKARLERFVPPL
jgi:aminoglycoside phosphotransferase (APT) family kinase protein